MARKGETINVTGIIMAQTAKAIKFHSDFMDEEVWLPRSQIVVTFEDETQIGNNARASVQVPVWLVEKNGIK